MTDEQLPNVAIPWYQSKIIQRLAFSIVVQVLALLHVSNKLASADLALLIDDVLEAFGIIYAAWAVHARVAHPVPPVVSSQKKANIVNAVPDPSSPELPK